MAENGVDMCGFLTVSQMSMAIYAKMQGNDMGIVYPHNKEIYDMFHVYGGISSILTKHVEANVPNTDTYNPALPTKHFRALDATALYASVMHNYKMPYAEYTFVEGADTWTQQMLMGIDTEGDYHHQVECDIMLPAAYHDDPRHFNFPLLLSQRSIADTELSARQLSYRSTATSGGFTKLVTDFLPKQHYTIDLRMLQVMCRSGYEIGRAHV